MQLLDVSVFWASFVCDVYTMQTQPLLDYLHTPSLCQAYGDAYTVGD